MDLNDHSAIRAVLDGNPDAYRAVVVRHSAALFRVAFRITGNEADADEVVQEAFLRGYQRLGSFQFQSSFRTWIYRITVNCSFDCVQRRSLELADQTVGTAEDDRRPRTELADSSGGPERALLNEELGQMQSMAMRALTPLERTAFLLRHVEGQSTVEIGAALDIGPSAVKQAVFRAVQKLRQRLGSLRGSI